MVKGSAFTGDGFRRYKPTGPTLNRPLPDNFPRAVGKKKGMGEPKRSALVFFSLRARRRSASGKGVHLLFFSAKHCLQSARRRKRQRRFSVCRRRRL